MPKRSRTPSPILEPSKKLKSRSRSSRTCAVCLGSIEKEEWRPCPAGNATHGMCFDCSVQVRKMAKKGHRKHTCPTCRASLVPARPPFRTAEARLARRDARTAGGMTRGMATLFTNLERPIRSGWIVPRSSLVHGGVSEPLSGGSSRRIFFAAKGDTTQMWRKPPRLAGDPVVFRSDPLYTKAPLYLKHAVTVTRRPLIQPRR